MKRPEIPWSDEVRRRLALWCLWASEDKGFASRSSVLAEMIRRAAGELPGDDISVPKELTPEIEVTEKAVARMKLSGISRDRHARRLIIDIYLKGKNGFEIETERGWTKERRKMEQWRAESICGRYMTQIEQEMSAGVAEGKISA